MNYEIINSPDATLITVTLPSPQARPNAVSRVLAVFSFRYDAHLVPDLLANIKPIVDGWVSFDDTGSRELFSDEPARRHALLTAARSAGAQWILAVDPDERFESNLAVAMPALTGIEGSVAYTFALREMYDTEHYRIDGVWGQKTQTRLFRMSNEICPARAPLHSPWHHMIPDAEVRDSGFDLYHLKMITASRRRARADLYQHLDPQKQYQPIGYEYLADDKNAVFARIPDRRGYQPKHHEDNGLWMPNVTGSNTDCCLTELA